MPRRTDLNDEIQAQICSALQRGLTIRDACDYAGISESSFHTWRRKGEDHLRGEVIPGGNGERYAKFAQAALRAKSSGRARALDIIQKAMPEDWRAAVEFLRLSASRDYGRKYQVIEHSGPAGKGIQVKVDARTDEEREASIKSALQGGDDAD